MSEVVKIYGLDFALINKAAGTDIQCISRFRDVGSEPPEPETHILLPDSDVFKDISQYGMPEWAQSNLYSFVDEGYDNYDDDDYVTYTQSYPMWLGIPSGGLSAGDYKIKFRARARTGDANTAYFRVSLVTGFVEFYGDQGTILHYDQWDIIVSDPWASFISEWSSPVSIASFADLSLKVEFRRSNGNVRYGDFSVVEIQLQAA